MLLGPSIEKVLLCPLVRGLLDLRNYDYSFVQMEERTKVSKFGARSSPQRWVVHAEALGGLSGLGQWLWNKNSNLLGVQLFLGGRKQE